MQQWEYLILDKRPNNDELDRLGAVGWELVTVSEIDEFNQHSISVTLYFKRPKA